MSSKGETSFFVNYKVNQGARKVKTRMKNAFRSQPVVKLLITSVLAKDYL